MWFPFRFRNPEIIAGHRRRHALVESARTPCFRGDREFRGRDIDNDLRRSFCRYRRCRCLRSQHHFAGFAVVVVCSGVPGRADVVAAGKLWSAGHVRGHIKEDRR